MLGDPQGQNIFIKTALNQIGTHCLQKFFDFCSKTESLIIQITSLIKTVPSDQIMLLIKNLNGCHVLKKILMMFCPIDFRGENH